MKRAKELREQWQLEQEDLAENCGDKQRARMLRRIRKTETIRQTHHTVRTTLSGRTGGALSSLIFNDENGQQTTTYNPTIIAEKLISRNLEHFHQAHGTAFTTEQVQTICEQPLEQAITQLKELTGQGNEAFDAVITELD